MKIRLRCFNTYLLSLLLAGALGGCSSTRSEKFAEASLRFFLETNLDGTEVTQTVKVGRSAPITVNIETHVFLTEFNIEKASVVDAPGGFAISVQFDRQGTWILEQYSTAHRGKRTVVAAEFGELRWIAAPLMRERITNGHFVFTADTTREEAEKIVSGVNRVAELVRKGRK